MSSWKEVKKLLRQHVAPVLVERGFKNPGVVMWRMRPPFVDVVQFRCYRAGHFQLEYGCTPRGLDARLPRAYECMFRIRPAGVAALYPKASLFARLVSLCEKVFLVARVARFYPRPFMVWRMASMCPEAFLFARSEKSQLRRIFLIRQLVCNTVDEWFSHFVTPESALAALADNRFGTIDEVCLGQPTSTAYGGARRLLESLREP